VLVREVLGYLCNGPGVYLDATLGDGGHAAALLGAEPGARVLGTDRDPGAVDAARERLGAFGDRVMLAHARFSDLPGVLRERGVRALRGALLDLGVSSGQLDDPRRGMSFRAAGPLDLRMDPTRGERAADKLARTDEEELAQVLAEEGEVPRPRAVARAMLRARDAGTLETTADVAHAAARAMGGRPHPRRLAQVFQALRRWVNDEGAELRAALACLAEAMEPGGVLVTIAYHSGEDRVIKRSFRATPGRAAAPRFAAAAPAPASAGAWEPLTRRVVSPSDEERARNPRARSARLRAARRRSP
jgi:16S rRNA (cytosine1402-N4)-methyltransferase